MSIIKERRRHERAPEESEQPSPATSEKKIAQLARDREQPVTLLDEESGADYGPLPSKAQMQYHREELAAFASHFGMNTYYDRSGEMGKKILIILSRASGYRSMDQNPEGYWL